MGDAAHPLQPTISQGANLAPEDGASLGRLLPAAEDLERGLLAFDRARVERTWRTSVLASRMARWGLHQHGKFHGLGLNAISRIMPSSWVAGALKELTGWRPPQPPSR